MFLDLHDECTLVKGLPGIDLHQLRLCCQRELLTKLRSSGAQWRRELWISWINSISLISAFTARGGWPARSSVVDQLELWDLNLLDCLGQHRLDQLPRNSWRKAWRPALWVVSSPRSSRLWSSMATGFNLSSAEVSKVLPKGKISCLGPTVDMSAGGHLS